MIFTKHLKQLSKKDVKIAGGKGSSLGEMIQNEIPVPPGFVILTSAFNSFSKNNEISKELEKEILVQFKKLNSKFVAVRSSATSEDSSTASWAGQLESYLNVTQKDLLKNIKKCWLSLSAPRVISYRREKNLLKKDIGLAVIVQKMIQSEISGVCFTVHPVSKNKDHIIIEAVWGLGEALVQGTITPDSYVIDKRDWSFVDVNEQGKQKLDKKRIIKLAKICGKIERYYKKPQDIEWALKEGKFYILQSRPITTL